jgi:hypothetical protein
MQNGFGLPGLFRAIHSWATARRSKRFDLYGGRGS